VRSSANSLTLVYRFFVLYVNLPCAPEPSHDGSVPSLKNLRLHSNPSPPMIPEFAQKADQKASSSRLSRNRLLCCLSNALLNSSFVETPLLQLSFEEPYSIQERQQQLSRSERA
jgi:hypothetical protein